MRCSSWFLSTFSTCLAALACSACGSDPTPAAAGGTYSDAKGDATGSDTAGLSSDGAVDAAGATGDASSPGDSAGSGADASADVPPAPPFKICGKYLKESEVTPAAGNTLFKDGDYFLAVHAAPFDLVLPFKAVILGDGTAGEGGKLRLLALRPINAKSGEVGDVIAAACDVPVGKDGTFTANFGEIILPAKSSPAGSDVTLSLELVGALKSADMACGLVEGKVPIFKLELTGSKFKAVPFGKQPTPPETSCEGTTSKQHKPIEKCPVLTAGANAFKSAELDRTFDVWLPAAGAPTTPVPLVFLYHGVGGSAASIVKDSGFAKLLDTEKFVLVVPNSSTPEGKKLALDWFTASAAFTNDNPDLVFFDDLVKCAGESFKIDADRVYVAGMSGGGLMTVMLTLHRAKSIAAAAPFSGGYLHAWSTPAGSPPVLVTWGGKTDESFAQKFDVLAQELLTNFKKDGRFVVRCEHTLGHKWPLEMNVAAWKFLASFTRGKADNPLAAGLGKEFPAYCAIAK
ncbi:MAG: hypothetical protein EXR79_15225 [Myxococcales bacterium]|nr:hypothetical protein [Myxococcales bacterium]